MISFAGDLKSIRITSGIRAAISLAFVATIASSGCARNLRIGQSDYVNNAMQSNLDPKDRVGEPLELAVVCVYPGDLVDGPNMLLDPANDISAKDWFDKCPLPGDDQAKAKSEGRIWLPTNQIFWLTNKTSAEVYGKIIYAALRGAKKDGAEILVKGIQYSAGGLHDDKAVIYVVPKFFGESGEILPVRPARFHPPGAYTADLGVFIGVDPGRDNGGQFIELRAERKMHGEDDKADSSR